MKLKSLFVLGLALLIAGCNIFSWTSSSDADELYYEGIKLFNQKKFDDAKQKFAEAMEKEPTCSEYRYYHAKAAIYEASINFLSVGRDVIEPPAQKSGSRVFFLPLYSRDPNLNEQQRREEEHFKNTIYQIVSVCHEDIDPIFKGETYGEIKRKDILFEYSLFSLARSLLQFRDTNNDGVIDSKDIYFYIYSDSDQNVHYDIIIPPDLDPNEILESVENAISYLADGTSALVEAITSEYIDTTQLNETMDQIMDELKNLLP